LLSYYAAALIGTRFFDRATLIFIVVVLAIPLGRATSSLDILNAGSAVIADNAGNWLLGDHRAGAPFVIGDWLSVTGVASCA
jgi:hypothetical protein